MARTIQCCGRVFAAGLCLLCAGGWAWASPTGLNNIPTTDTAPKETLVFQTWGNMADDRHPQQFWGFKYGVTDALEVGSDWKSLDQTHGHAAFQAKYAFDIKQDFWRGVAGVANLSDHRQHQGDFFPYVATSFDLKAVRFHAGYDAQRDNEGFFWGFDKAVPFLNRDLVLRADAIQVNEMDDILYSAGFLYNLRRRDDDGKASRPGLKGLLDKIFRNIVLEGWVTIPSTRDEEVLTLKLNYVLKF